MEYKISIKRSLPDIQPTGEFKVSTPQPFEGKTVTVLPGGAVLFAGLLPRKQQLVEGEDDPYSGNILRAFLNPATPRRATMNVTREFLSILISTDTHKLKN